jgi:hypothetical protein
MLAISVKEMRPGIGKPPIAKNLTHFFIGLMADFEIGRFRLISPVRLWVPCTHGGSCTYLLASHVLSPVFG